MDTIKIYGQSDDNVEIEGTVPGCDEYSSWNRATFVELATGDVFKVEYTTEGVWTVEHIQQSGKVATVKTRHADGEDTVPYTDTMVIVGANIRWVQTWSAWPPNAAQVRDILNDEYEQEGSLPDYLNNAELFKIFSIMMNAKRRKK